MKVLNSINSEFGEITFIAARDERNLNGYTYEVATLLAQDKSGVYQPISESREVSIPLMLDHSESVGDKVGVIYNAKIIKLDGLNAVEMTARLFNNETAQAVRERVLNDEITDVSITTDLGSEEDAITSGNLKNAKIIEVSLVYAGAEPRAKILAKNSAKGEQVENLEKDNATSVAENEIETGDVDDGVGVMDLSEVVEEMIQPLSDKVESIDSRLVALEGKNNEEEGEGDMPAQNKTDDAVNTATRAQVVNSIERLAKSGAIKGMNKNEVVEAVQNDIKITDGREGVYVVPEALFSEVVFKNKSTEILDTFNTIEAKRFTVLEEKRTDADLERAGKWSKAEKKKIQEATLVPRRLQTGFIYKMQQISYEDLQEDFGNILYNAIVKELPARVDEEQERAFIVGDGRETSDSRHITDIKSLDAAAEDSQDVAVYKHTAQSGEPKLKSILDGIAKIGETGTRYAVMNIQTLNELRLAGLEKSAGLPFSEDVIAGALGVEKIFVRDYVAVDAVYVYTGEYIRALVGAGEQIEQYDIDYNNQKIEYIRPAGGAATGVYSAVKIDLTA